MSEPLVERVRRVVSDVFGVPLAQVEMSTSHDDVDGWDSLGTIQLMMALEGEFGVALDVDDAADLLSVRLVTAVLEEKGVS